MENICTMYALRGAINVLANIAYLEESLLIGASTQKVTDLTMHPINSTLAYSPVTPNSGQTIKFNMVTGNCNMVTGHKAGHRRS